MRTDGDERQLARSCLPRIDEVLVGSGRAYGSDRVVGDDARAKILAPCVTGNSREPSPFTSQEEIPWECFQRRETQQASWGARTRTARRLFYAPNHARTEA